MDDPPLSWTARVTLTADAIGTLGSHRHRAGLSGMYALYRLRQLGLKVHVYEAGHGVGGQPVLEPPIPARLRFGELDYGFSFSDDIRANGNWKEHFSGQPETCAMQLRRRQVRPLPRHPRAPASSARQRTDGGDRKAARRAGSVLSDLSDSPASSTHPA